MSDMCTLPGNNVVWVSAALADMKGIAIDRTRNNIAYKEADEIFDILEDTLAFYAFDNSKKAILHKNRIIDVLNDMDPSLVRIKQCPCGGITEILGAENKEFCKMVCDRCGRTIDIQDDKLDAVKAWNFAIFNDTLE